MDSQPRNSCVSNFSASNAPSSHRSLSSLSKSKGFIVENPDGTLIQGFLNNVFLIKNYM